jgi:hypothetical protein
VAQYFVHGFPIGRPDTSAQQMASRYNERKAIDAVLRRIEARDQAVRLNDGRSPDDLNDPDPLRRVDYVSTVGKTLHAFEHPGIEPFAGQIESEVHNENLFAPIVARFSNQPDQEFWEFHVPVEASTGLTGAHVKRVQDALITWINANASRFPVTCCTTGTLIHLSGRGSLAFHFRCHCIGVRSIAAIFRVKTCCAGSS